jgi:dolichol-phosphate mannosyltransferase
MAWVGFKSTQIEIERPERFAGNSKFHGIKLRKAVIWALGAIFMNSSEPLIWISYIGFGFSVLSLLGTGIFAISWVLYGVPFAGFGTLMGFMSLSFSLTLMSLGIIAHYVALIYEESKQRPIYVVAETTQSLSNGSKNG